MEAMFAGYSYANLTSVAMHRHSYWEIVIFLEGSGIHTVGRESLNFKPKTIVCQPPDIDHGTKADDRYRDMYIGVKDFPPLPSKGFHVFIDDEENRFQTLASLLHSTLHRKEFNYKQTANAIFNSMYQILTGWSIQEPKNSIIDYALSEIVSNYANPKFSTAILMKNINYTSDHFRRMFKKETGKTPTSYLLDLRINHAKTLLKQRNDKAFLIKDISILSGFNDPYYFSRLFKERTGVSPVDFS